MTLPQRLTLRVWHWVTRQHRNTAMCPCGWEHPVFRERPRVGTTDYEQTLISAAETQPWTPELHDALRRAVEHRGGNSGPKDSAGMLADLLCDLASGENA